MRSIIQRDNGVVNEAYPMKYGTRSKKKSTHRNKDKGRRYGWRLSCTKHGLLVEMMIFI